MSKIKEILFDSEKPQSLAAGLGLAVIVVIIASYIGKYMGIVLSFEKSPISTITLAIILGLIIKNIMGVPQIFTPGIKFCLKSILKLGIIMLGAGLSLFIVVKVSILTVGIVVICIASGLAIVYLIAKKLGINERLGTLIAVGTGICGATAIVAAGPVIKAKEEEIAYAVATITIFGIIAMFSYPYITHFLGLTDVQAGIVMGTGVHDTSQVAGAGLMYDQLWGSEGSVSGGNVAIITKLIRNIFIAMVIPLMAYLYIRKGMTESGKKISLTGLFPMFIIGFILMAAARTAGDYLIINNGMLMDPAAWSNLLSLIKDWATNFLAVTMAGVGLGTNICELKNLSLKPFLAGLLGALSVGIISLILVTVLAQYLVI